EELVPGAEAREDPVDVHAEWIRRDLAVALARLGRESLLDRQRVAAEQRGALRELAGEILLPRLDLAAELVLPRREPVGPGRDGVEPAAGTVDGERSGPAVVPERLQRLLAPTAVARAAHAHGTREHVVAVLEDGRVD